DLRVLEQRVDPCQEPFPEPQERLDRGRRGVLFQLFVDMPRHQITPEPAHDVPDLELRPVQVDQPAKASEESAYRPFSNLEAVFVPYGRLALAHLLFAMHVRKSRDGRGLAQA